MLAKNLLILVVLATAVHCKPKKSDDDDEISLNWPKKYHVEVTKYLIKAGLTEDVQIWKTAKESRIDYNKGAVKSIVTKGKRKKDRGYTYEIHPETHGLDQLNEIKCSRKRRARWSSGPEDILPDAEDFEYVGVENRGSQLCTKFVKETKEDEYVFLKETVWATHNKEDDSFVPQRYEVERINDWAGNLNEHDIWEFENFDVDFDEKEVLDASQFCSDYVEVADEDDELVTKHLMFVDPENEHHVNHVFRAFKKNFNKNYAHTKEHSMRKNIFQKNLRLIKTTNRKNLGYKLAVNKFSDRTPEEMKRHMGLMRRPEGAKGMEFPYDSQKLSATSETLPHEYDLRLEGIISPVQNQEECGSCWTFGTTSAIEGAIARQNGGQLIRLSNQALVDCAWEFNAFGCEGGTDTAVYEWTKKYGMPKLSDYGSYTAADGYCSIANMTTTYKIRGFVDVTANSISALKVALVENGPLSVSVHASTDAFRLYNGGIYYDMQCGNEPGDLDHEVTLIGYGEQYGDTFWILKNSWGPDWGIDGYMHIAAKDNNCGIMTEPTYVLV